MHVCFFLYKLKCKVINLLKRLNAEEIALHTIYQISVP